jgi:hypothetical protein
MHRSEIKTFSGQLDAISDSGLIGIGEGAIEVGDSVSEKLVSSVGGLETGGDFV